MSTDERARFEAIFTAHYPVVVRYAVRRVGVDAAPDVVSETFLAAWRRLADVPEAALPWLLATARRVVANELRRRARAGRLGERVAAQPAAASGDPGDVVPERVRVRAALDTLRPRDREAVLLAEWEQLSTRDAAFVLGCSTAAYKVRLHRARRRLAVLLDDHRVQPGIQGEPA